jgi:hypothetical protein
MKDLLSKESFLEKTLTKIFLENFPFKLLRLPEKFQQVLIQYLPWFNVFLLGLILFSFITIWLSFDYLKMNLAEKGKVLGIPFYSTILFALIISILEIFALSGLFKKQRTAWAAFFYICLTTFVWALLNFSIEGMFFSLAFLFLIFQIKTQYS